MVKLTVTDSHFQRNDTTYASIIHPGLIAYSHGPYSGVPHNPVTFTGSATGGCPPYAWYWDFGDGNTSTQQNPSHTYAVIGNYTAIVTVTDNSGYHDSDETTVDVTLDLRANAYGPYNGSVNIPVQFSGNASGGSPPYTWLWDFGDGNTSTQQKLQHTYETEGNYTVLLTVKDSSNNVDNVSTYAEIIDAHIGIPVIEKIQGGFGVRVDIKNIGTGNCTNVSWFLTITGGLIFSGVNTSGFVDDLQPEATVTVRSSQLKGIGRVTVTVVAADANKQATAFLLGPLVLRVKEL
jgi:PKD repeat protein